VGGINDLLVWLNTRVFNPRIALLYTLLVLGLWVCSYPVSIVSFIKNCAILLALLVTFRLWDDLADRQYDKTRSKDLSDQRILLTSHYIRWFNITLVIAMLVLGIIIYQRDNALALSWYLILCLGFSFLYYTAVISPASRFKREILVLMKYPSFILLVSASTNLKAIAVATGLYTMLSLNYFFEHRALKASQ